MGPIFFYGSLRDNELLSVVLNRRIAADAIIPARAVGYATLKLKHEAYPYLAPVAGAAAEGIVVTGLSAADFQRLCYFEEVEYALSPVHVVTEKGPMDAVYFGPETKLVGHKSDDPWDFETWQHEERVTAIEAAREMMAHIEHVPAEEIDRIWPGIMIRAQMRARARNAKAPSTMQYRTPAAPDDVVQIGIERPYTAYFAVEEHTIRHRTYGGTMSGPIERAVFSVGDAVSVLPYDPRRDEVLLIEQFRAGPHARGDKNPWVLDVIAGRMDQEKDAVACARREAIEEAGLSLGRIEKITTYYPSPAYAAEEITAFVGEADLQGKGGVFGLGCENEDIRAFTLRFDQAMTALAGGEITGSPAVISLLWLAGNRDRLRREWC